MRDLAEGVAADGTIVTGVARSAVPTVFEPVLDAIGSTMTAWPHVSWYVYGSVATGRARVGRSDVDVLTLGLPAVEAARLGAELTAESASVCRGVEIAAAQADDLVDSGDEAYGLRVFVKHYCVHLGGPDPTVDLPAHPADARAARGFNGDIARHRDGWREAVDVLDPAVLGRRVARKTLLAVAGLVSVLQRTWTTDRELAAQTYAGLRPERAPEISLLWAWADGVSRPDRDAVLDVLRPDGAVDQVVDEFASVIGVWPDGRSGVRGS